MVLKAGYQKGAMAFCPFGLLFLMNLAKENDNKDKLKVKL